MKWNKKLVSATGSVGLPAGTIYGGLICQVVGTTTTVTVYDDVAATAANLITPVTATATTNIAGAYISPFGSGVSALTVAPTIAEGLQLERGLYITIGGTGTPSFWVLYQ
jgi:hypothetical protein